MSRKFSKQKVKIYLNFANMLNNKSTFKGHDNFNASTNLTVHISRLLPNNHLIKTRRCRVSIFAISRFKRKKAVRAVPSFKTFKVCMYES